jgi:hypothetical protein
LRLDFAQEFIASLSIAHLAYDLPSIRIALFFKHAVNTLTGSVRALSIPFYIIGYGA